VGIAIAVVGVLWAGYGLFLTAMILHVVLKEGVSPEIVMVAVITVAFVNFLKFFLPAGLLVGLSLAIDAARKRRL
jgi:hypothetical protein